MTQVNYCVVFLALLSSAQCFDLLDEHTKSVIVNNLMNINNIFLGVLSNITLASITKSFPAPPKEFKVQCIKEFNFDPIQTKFSAGFKNCIDNRTHLITDSKTQIDAARQEFDNTKGVFNWIPAGIAFAFKVFSIFENAIKGIAVMDCVEDLKEDAVSGFTDMVNNVNKCVNNN